MLLLQVSVRVRNTDRGSPKIWVRTPLFRRATNVDGRVDFVLRERPSLEYHPFVVGCGALEFDFVQVLSLRLDLRSGPEGLKRFDHSVHTIPDRPTSDRGVPMVLLPVGLFTASYLTKLFTGK